MLQKEEIKRIIETAFEDVALDGGISLEQTKVIDNYGISVTTKEFSALPNKEVTNNWKEIPASRLDEAECIAHLDNKGFKYYIPALMLRLLDSYNSTCMMSIGTISSLYPRKKEKEYFYSELNEQQKQAIALYLKALPNLINLDTEDKKIVERAFNKYWSKFLPPYIK